MVSDNASPIAAFDAPSLRGPTKLRWRLALTLMVTLFVGYLDRMNISLGMPLIAQHHGWSLEETRQHGSTLMTVFYVGYGLANLFLSGPATWLGPRWSLAGVILLWSVFTAMGAWLSASLMALMVTRFLLGLSEGVHFPMMNVLTQRWFPLQERARANSVWMAGLLLAVCLGPVLLIPLMSTVGWQASFWVLSAAGPIVSLPLVWRHVFNRPSDHPTMTPVELRHIQQDLVTAVEDAASSKTAKECRSTWLQAMVSFDMLVILFAGLAYNIVAVGLSSWLPTYLVTNKGLPYADLVYAASLPYISGVVGLALWSWLGDRLQMRAALGAVGFVVGAVALWGALRAPTLAWSIAGFSAAVFGLSAFSACEFAVVQRLLPPRVVGSGAGAYNGLTTLVGGGLGPIMVSSLIGMKATGQVQGMVVVIAVCLFASLLLVILARRLKY